MVSLPLALAFTCFSMFVYICTFFHFVLIGGNLTAQSTGSHRGIGGGIQVPETQLQALLPFLAPPQSAPEILLAGQPKGDIQYSFTSPLRGSPNLQLFSSTFVNICLVWCSIKIYRKYSEVRTTATLLERSTSRVSLRFLTVLLRLNNVRETRCQRPLSSGSFLVQARPCDQLNSTKFLLFSIPYLY